MTQCAVWESGLDTRQASCTVCIDLAPHVTLQYLPMQLDLSTDVSSFYETQVIHEPQDDSHTA
jgi:hypothetical protein